MFNPFQNFEFAFWLIALLTNIGFSKCQEPFRIMGQING